MLSPCGAEFQEEGLNTALPSLGPVTDTSSVPVSEGVVALLDLRAMALLGGRTEDAGVTVTLGWPCINHWFCVCVAGLSQHCPTVVPGESHIKGLQP